MTTDLPQRLRELGADFTSHPLSRGIEDCEAAGEAMTEAAAEIEDSYTTIMTLGALLERVANAVRGEPPKGVRWSYDDLPDRVAAEIKRLRTLRKAARKAVDAWFERDDQAEMRSVMQDLRAALAAQPQAVAREDDLLALQRFAAEVMGEWPDVGIDGFELQDLGTKCGLIKAETRTAPCGEYCQCSEFETGEVECFRVQPVLKRAISAAAPAGEPQAEPKPFLVGGVSGYAKDATPQPGQAEPNQEGP